MSICRFYYLADNGSELEKCGLKEQKLELHINDIEDIEAELAECICDWSGDDTVCQEPEA